MSASEIATALFGARPKFSDYSSETTYLVAFSQWRKSILIFADLLECKPASLDCKPASFDRMAFLRKTGYVI